MKIFYAPFLTLLLFFFSINTNAQYALNGAAIGTNPGIPNATCFSLTPPSGLHQAGSVWSNTQVDLNQNFVVSAKLWFGSLDADGADGIAFMLQRAGTSALGVTGGGIGYYQIPGPSLVVEFDTWTNVEPWFTTGDPWADHIGFMKNADVFHNGPNALAPPVAFPVNIEDGQWHDAVFTWNATTKTLTVQFLGNTYTYTGDIVNTIFGGNSMVYWGFTAATGSYTPIEHKVCIISTPPPPPGDCGQLRTQTPGGWGAEPHGNNPGTYLHDHFAAAFPTGLTVGSLPNYNAHFTSADAITDYLPAGGQAKKLDKNYTDPATNDLKNVLVNHLVALTLSVRFDQVDPNFGSAGVHLGDMIIGSGAFQNWTVNNFLVEANKVLGGTSNAYTIQQVLETASAINENYVDGKMDGGFLNCPGSQRSMASRPMVTEKIITPGFQLQPNPSTGRFAFRLEKGTSGLAQVQVTNASGTLVETRSVPLVGRGQTLWFDLSNRSSGIYIVRVQTNEGVQTQKIMIQK
jgi:hypothetical protein